MRVILHDLEPVPSVLDGAPTPTVCVAGDDGLDQLTSALTGPSRDEMTLVLAPAWSPAAQRDVATARATTDLPRVISLTTTLPPGAAGVLGSLVVRMAGRVLHPGTLPAAVRLLHGRIAAHALLDSVTGLERLQPSLGQHVSSWLPNSRFLATTSPTQQLQRLGRREQPRLQPVDDAGATVVLGAPSPLRDQLVEAASAREGAHDPAIGTAPARSAAWWGTAEVVEVVDHPADLDRLSSWLHGQLPAVNACSWCGDLMPPGPCSFCGHLNDAAA